MQLVPAQLRQRESRVNFGEEASVRCYLLQLLLLTCTQTEVRRDQYLAR